MRRAAARNASSSATTGTKESNDAERSRRGKAFPGENDGTASGTPGTASSRRTGE